jgi:tetratricopeptide (TPR) repeat protein
MTLHQQVATLEDKPARRAVAWTALGLLYLMFGRLAEALSCDRAALNTGVGEGHPELALEIVKAMIRAGAARDAGPYLARALADDETRVAAHVFASEHLMTVGAAEAALSHLVAAREAAPAWTALLKPLASVQRVLGDAEGARRSLEQHADQEMRTVRVAQRLVRERLVIPRSPVSTDIGRAWLPEHRGVAGQHGAYSDNLKTISYVIVIK